MAAFFAGYEVDEEFQPVPRLFDFDLDERLSSVVALEAWIPEDAFSARAMRTHRVGNAIVIGAEGLMLTISYLITEAEAVVVSTNDGVRIPAHVLGVDQATGFALIHALEPLGLPAPKLDHSPITGVHLWFDREITTLPHATLLDRTMQWMFNKDGGKYLQLVVSASRDLTPLTRNEIVEIAIGDLRLYFPRVKEATLVKSHVVKEQRATFSAAPETEQLRPGTEAAIPHLFMAGDWTRTGWPATMEGAVRSGYLAAEGVLKKAGSSQKFLLA